MANGMWAAIHHPRVPAALLQIRNTEGGVIFSDGVEADALAFNAGAVATISLAEKKTRLVVG